MCRVYCERRTKSLTLTHALINTARKNRYLRMSACYCKVQWTASMFAFLPMVKLAVAKHLPCKVQMRTLVLSRELCNNYFKSRERWSRTISLFILNAIWWSFTLINSLIAYLTDSLNERNYLSLK